MKALRMTTPEALEKVVEQVAQSKKYRHVAPSFIRRIAAAALHSHPKLKDAVKATKNKLHQVAGAYLDNPPPYAKWQAELEHSDDVQATCRRMMQAHASTRERLSILEDFYTAVFNDIGTVNSVLDLACGLNPLAAPWMKLAPNATYIAHDLYSDMMEFLQNALPHLGLEHVTARAADIATLDVYPVVDVAVIFKTLPVLEQSEKDSASKLLQRINAKTLVVSYPSASLGGRRKGMAAQYTAQFETLMAQIGGVIIKRLDFHNEIVFLASIQSP